MTTKENIFELIQSNHKKSEGKCGLSIGTILSETQSEYKTIKAFLNQLYSEKKIIIRKGINGNLIFSR